MSFLKQTMSTQLPGAVLFPRLFMATVLIVDALRGWNWNAHLGPSAISNLQLSSVMLVKTLCALHAVCGVLIAIGLFTRLAVIPVMVLWTFEIMAAWSRVGTRGTAGAIDATQLAVGVISVGLLLLFRGPGIWSVDASVSRPPG